MLLGFISLLLTVGQGPISDMCISRKIGSTWHPCSKEEEEKLTEEDHETDSETSGRKLLMVPDAGATFRRILASSGNSTDACAAKVRPSYIPSFI